MILLNVVFFAVYFTILIFVGNRFISLDSNLGIFSVSMFVLLAAVFLAQVTVDKVIEIVTE